jgi:hypothetical protein
MVIVLVAAAVNGTEVATRALAERLGWAYAAVGRGDDVRRMVRRESLVLAWPTADVARAAEELDGLRPVRFVSFQSTPAPVPFQALGVDAAANVDVIVGLVRLEFGI